MSYITIRIGLYLYSIIIEYSPFPFNLTVPYYVWRYAIWFYIWSY
nr:MAG TPA: hypothetical protein [Caudoviricetes sp.]